MKIHLIVLRYCVVLCISGAVGSSVSALSASPDMSDACYAPTQPLTLELRKAFVSEIKPLAVKAEKDHGVPAAILAAMAIHESGYGTTQLAIAAHNVLSYKWNSRQGPDGRAVFTLACQPAADAGNTYVVFRDRADSADFVAGKLATSVYYRAATQAYRKAVAEGQDRKSAATAWLKAIAPSYNPYHTEKYIEKILVTADDPIQQSGQINVSDNLWQIGQASVQANAIVATSVNSVHVEAVAHAQRSAYARVDATNGCPVSGVDVFGWPGAMARECVYNVGSSANKRTGYVVLLDIPPAKIAKWIESACSAVLPDKASCFKTVLECGRLNSGMMFPIAGNMMENMGGGSWKNYFFRNGMTVGMSGQENGTDKQIPLEHQKKLALLPNAAVSRIPSGLTRFWRTTPTAFFGRFPGVGVPVNLNAAEDRQKWLNLVQTEILYALDSSENRLLEAWVATKSTSVAQERCGAP